MKVLVTGGTGFLGYYIVKQLLELEATVTVLTRRPELEQHDVKLIVISGDICDAPVVLRACEGNDTVFHVAAKTGIWGTWDSFYRPNVLGTQNVISACQEMGVSKLIFTSSPSVVFDNTNHEGDDETLPYPLEYENNYSHTKALAEQIVLKSNSAKLSTVALRPHLIWGPRDNNLLPRLIARAKAGRLIQIGDGTNKVDLTYVEDAARAHLLACNALDSPLKTRVAGSVYFISQDEPVLLWTWIKNLLHQLKLPPIKHKIPKSVARAVGGLMEFGFYMFNSAGEPPMTRFLASSLAMSHYYDISKAKRDLGYQPQFSMTEALKRYTSYE